MEIFIGVLIGLVLGSVVFYIFLRKPKKQPPIPPPKVDDTEHLINERQSLLETLKMRTKEEQERLSNTINEWKEYVEEIKDYRDEGALLRNSIQSLTVEIDMVRQQKAKEEEGLNTLISSVQNILDEQKREALASEFYKLHISENSQLEINELSSIASRYPKVKSALMSAVYSHYFAAEVASMCNRVVGTSKVSGIYKITNSKNGMVYVGKSVDIKNRWTQHIKRAVGVEKETQNLLYPAMREHKVWNFSFEILEEVASDKLSEREKFWQNVYKAKEDYSIK